ncbi:concanavalin A-like lectin/glucanase domain-containing protein [Cercophora newfieldiana]|uniref:Concanavalin A-like lectin/glucanase domain-containing protein n=1 Tax=Cercophora newfieldiana TaxID=92897 RepID=A0AA39Y5M3_9PEZI|nr:concanavalin A-like lectin/glucanase domain-containing protein [Cercophora newfieldiana]
MRWTSSAAALVASFVSSAQAQYLVNELSFGYGARIAPEGTYSVPNFALQGRPNIPEVLSNKLIMTPPAPGNQRGAIWAEKPVNHQSWIADVEFRVNGPERGAGNMNIWLVKDGAHNVGSESLYTVGKFEGLLLVVDQYGGSGGMVRGFLNDGTNDYKSNHHVDGLSFGNCYFPYRNLGRPIQIKLRHTDTKFSVEVDSHVCFESDHIRIPGGYNFGITAASADNPDSIEVYKLVVLSDDHNTNTNNHNQDHHNTQDHGSQAHPDAYAKPAEMGNKLPSDHAPPPPQQKMSFGRRGQVADDPFDNAIPDQEANKITSSAAQFADLHNRIQSLNHHLTSIFRALGQNAGIGEQRHEETSVMIGEIKGLMSKLDRLEAIDNRVREVETQMRALRNELTARLRDSENSIKYHVNDKHEVLTDHVKAHASTGHGKLIFVIVGSQVVMGGLYYFYKKRKSTPKKYL